MPAKSYFVRLFPDAARSGLPTSPKKTVSPVNNAICFPYLSLRRKQELSNVWPGVWITCSFIDPILKISPSFAS
jgi:hypothetical protein